MLCPSCMKSCGSPKRERPNFKVIDAYGEFEEGEQILTQIGWEVHGVQAWGSVSHPPSAAVPAKPTPKPW